MKARIKSRSEFRPRAGSLVERKPKVKKHKNASSIFRDFDMVKYANLFKEHEIDVDAFKLLEESDLIEMGIQKASARKKIMTAVKHLRSSVVQL